MMEIILGVGAAIAIGITLALYKVAGEVDRELEHPERVTLKGD